MTNLFRIIKSNFFQILSSINKEIYIDCLFILDKLANEDEEFNINKDIALNILEKYFKEKSKILVRENNDDLEFINNHRQKALKVISLFKKNGWLSEERISFNITNLHFFDYSIEMIFFLKKTINQIKPESIENIYSIYYLLKTSFLEKNFNILKEIVIITKNILIKLKILKANIYFFYNQLINTNFDYNLNKILEQLLLNYKKNFFDSSYYILKTTNNFSKYRIKINLMLNKIESKNFSFEEIDEIKKNLKLIDKLTQIIDQKNEQYLQISCNRILFFYNQKKNIKNILNCTIKFILNNNINIHFYDFFNLSIIKNLDELSFYKPRVNKLKILTSKLDKIPVEIKYNLKNKKKNFLNKKNYFDNKNINLFVEKILNKKKYIKASQISLQNNQDISKLILIYLYSKSSCYKNIYQIKKLNQKVNKYNLIFLDFEISKIN
ncbi:MAG: DUF5716 family protein [Candidatus Phytoplasma stylosanthis]|uniref:Wadjet anti-phage system protein JetA family protein n=1 Tax=Candidatus Phytoplasma stylosanthis TaxID=2798314 RepID=UPI00293A6AC5|nr:Wadjet anti-phage system protein JetA family protein [Candidatus Phytoplasma stylosanthis]MDV3167939.1 DUF5716 family protein [Candidatus Phytoplasma stylosanthis]MDV3173620.1 DUF5716 family protein [Candidatus Phytoplasma stylosanthis]MDV3174246.1 DUF5716 family protein [Candidatus Phytoplasma stylosanthis]MDV3202697.1 DUF5716 family protein [Candidatus Phytoplasma stylosanthis]